MFRRHRRTAVEARRELSLSLAVASRLGGDWLRCGVVSIDESGGGGGGGGGDGGKEKGSVGRARPERTCPASVARRLPAADRPDLVDVAGRQKASK